MDARLLILVVVILLTIVVASAPAPGGEPFRHGEHSCPENDHECREDLKAAQDATWLYSIGGAPAAMAAGYLPIPPGECESAPQGTMGTHYANLALMARHLPTLMTDGTAPLVNAMAPEILLFVPDRNLPGGQRLVAVEYFVPVVTDGRWRDDSEERPNPNEVNPPPKLFGRLFDGPMTHPNVPWHYDLHVWAWDENPRGLFAHWHPDISCDG